MTRTLAHITDLHLDDALAAESRVDARRNILKILNDIQSRDIKYLIITGDLGMENSFGWLMSEIDKRQLICTMTLGNHDSFRKLMGQRKIDGLRNTPIYETMMNETELAILDTSTGKFDESSREMVEQVLKGHDRSILFSHYPVLDCGDTVMDRKYPLENRDVLADCLSNAHGEIHYFCGHYHNKYELQRGNIRQYVTPSAAAQVAKRGDAISLEGEYMGYRIIKIDEALIDTEVVMMESASL